jgi:hypothetical protein
LNQLNEQQQLEVEHLIDSNKSHEIEAYLEKRGVNINQLLAGVMTDFQASYLGA